MMQPQFAVKIEEETEVFTRFALEPLEQGYGHTLGNSLRRILLSSIKGAAITEVSIEGVQHQFSALEGLKEDVIELLLNLRKVRLHIDVDEPVTLTLNKKEEGPFHAGDISVSAGARIVNPELYLGTLSGNKARIDIKMKAETGYGYVTADQKKTDGIGHLPIDSNFSPVMRVNYKVEQTRVGRMTNLDKLIIEIWHDGSHTAREILDSAARTLVSYLSQILEPSAMPSITSSPVATSAAPQDDVMKMKIEELDIPTRIVNALANGGVETVGQLLEMPRAQLMKMKNLGGKSLGIIEEKLQERGINFSA